jgi:AAA domain, putative AbiEii toxin, Type IV TA system
MRLTEVSLTDFKGVEMRLPWSRINVLFGPNDAGKTNVLEGISSAFGETDLARPSDASGSIAPQLRALIELEPDEADDELLAALLQWDHVDPIFPVAARHPQGDSASRRMIGEAPHTASPARLRWFGSGTRTRSFTLAGTYVDSFPGDVDTLEEVRGKLYKRALRAIKRRTSDAPEADVDILLTAGLYSRRLLFEKGRVTWLCPSLDDCEEGVLDAAERLAQSGWRTDVVLGPLVAQLGDRNPVQQPFLQMMDKRDFRPFDIVWATAGLEQSDDLERPLRRAFDRSYEEIRRLGILSREILRLLPSSDEEDKYAEVLRRLAEDAKVTSNASPRDRWLRNFPMDPIAPSKWVQRMALLVGAGANRLAAPLVRDAGELEIIVRHPSHWLGDHGHRLEPSLHQPHRSAPTPFSELGLGLRFWSAVAVLEAATEQVMVRATSASMLSSMMESLRARRARGETDADDPYGLVDFEPEFGDRKRLLIVDEPERHLHPRAQREIARWLAESPDTRDTLIATHALPFLDMPSEECSYMLVTREADGVTRANDITDNMFDSLERMSVAAGLSGRAEALQTLRCVALVEGAHDERVLQHFFGGELARNRVLVAPVRGASKVSAIVDAPWLSRLEVPFVILFDEVETSIIEGSKRPGGGDLAAQAVWDLLRHWQGPRPRPYVASFGLADIFRALPEDCVRRAVKRVGGSFPGWTAIDAAFEAASKRTQKAGFKTVLRKQSKLASDTDLDELLDSILETCRKKPDPALRHAVQVVIDHARMSGRTPAPGF